RSSPAGPTTEPKVRSHEILSLLLHTILYTCASFSRSNSPRVTPSELDADQCTCRFEKGLSIRNALRVIKIDVKYNTFPARGLLRVFVCDNSSLIDRRRRTR